MQTVLSAESRDCVIVGAGMAGLTAAGVLREKGWRVVLVDKGRGVGGRLATRRIGESRFDHGAQFFTVRDSRFRQAVERWLGAEWAARWFVEDGHTRYRGREGMNSLAKELGKAFAIRTETEIAGIGLRDGRWRLTATSGETFEAGALLMTAPGPQTLALLEGVAKQLPSSLLRGLEGIRFAPCFALMAVLRGDSAIPEPGYLRPEGSPVSWMADNTRKGISTGVSAVTIHGSPEFSRAMFEAPREEVAGALVEAAGPWLGSEVSEWQLQRWKFSQPVSLCPEPCLSTSVPAPLAIAGDAFGGPRVEGAFLSGLAAAERLCEGG